MLLPVLNVRCIVFMGCDIDKRYEVIVWIPCYFQAYIFGWAFNLKSHRSEASVSNCQNPTGGAQVVVETEWAVEEVVCGHLIQLAWTLSDSSRAWRDD